MSRGQGANPYNVAQHINGNCDLENMRCILGIPKSNTPHPTNEAMGMESVKWVMKNGKCGQCLKGFNLSAHRISWTTSLRYSQTRATLCRQAPSEHHKLCDINAPLCAGGVCFIQKKERKNSSLPSQGPHMGQNRNWLPNPFLLGVPNKRGQWLNHPCLLGGGKMGGLAA